MTNSQVDGSTLVVVDGSNIATEGRSVPSLSQLNDAVMALTAEFPDITVTVVVDATFGHRIDKSEVSEFDEAVAHNELVTPPAGAIGRGDAFVLSIANKVGARIFSNDSFQEFHGAYPWLFDEGRLIGGKPVPHVGWVFVNRVPVKGPVSRKARSAGRDHGDSRRTASKLASLPMPIPTTPPPGRVAPKVETPPAEAPAGGSGRGRRRQSAEAVAAEPVPAAGKDAALQGPAAVPVSGGPVNDLLPFLDFVEHHPVGTAVTAVVETYSSHGAYVKIEDVRGYVPLRLMGSPPPRSAREVMRLGDMVSLVVTSFAPPRRSIDLAVPGSADIPPPPADEPAPKRRSRKASVAASPDVADAPPEASPEPSAEPRRRRRAAPAQPVDDDLAAAGAPAAEQASRPARKRAAADSASRDDAATPKRTRRTATADPSDTAPSAVPKKSAAKKSAAKKSAPKKSAAAKKTTPPSEPAAKRSSAAKTSSAAKQSAAPRTTSTTPAAEAATPAKKSRASTAAPAVAADEGGASPRRTAKKTAAPKSAATTAGRARASSTSAPRPRQPKTGD